MKKIFTFNSEVIDLSKKIKSLIEYESTRTSALTIAEQVLNSLSNLKDNLPPSPVRKYRNIKLAKTVIYSTLGIAIFGFTIYLIFKKPPQIEIPKEEPKTFIGVVTAQVANIRSGPSQNNPIIAKAQYGDTIAVISEASGWLLVRYQNLQGFVSGKLVKWQGNEDSGSPSRK